MEWIFFTIFAALMQSVRTAGQKQMTNNLTALVATWARYGFGLPVAVLYYLAIWQHHEFQSFETTAVFWVYLFVGALAQLLATFLLVKVLSLRNFAVGTAFIKSEVVLAGVIAAVVFGVSLSFWGWFAVVMGVSGLMFVSFAKAKTLNGVVVDPKSALFGLGAGLFFALASVLIREASLEMKVPATFAAAFILMLSLFIQGAVCTVLVHWQNPNNWRLLAKHLKLGWFIGVAGALGSIGWYTAFALQEVALVKTLGNIEFIFTLLITYFFFKERISRVELIGIAGIVASVLLLALA